MFVLSAKNSEKMWKVFLWSDINVAGLHMILESDISFPMFVRVSYLYSLARLAMA